MPYLHSEELKSAGQDCLLQVTKLLDCVEVGEGKTDNGIDTYCPVVSIGTVGEANISDTDDSRILIYTLTFFTWRIKLGG